MHTLHIWDGWVPPQSHIRTLRWHRTETHGSSCRSHSNHYLAPPQHLIRSPVMLPGETGAVLSVSQPQKEQTAALPPQAAALGHPAAQSRPFPVTQALTGLRDWHSDKLGRHHGNRLQTREGRHQGNQLLSSTAEIALESKVCHGKVSS